jgi:hypothetical protein
MYLVNKWWGFIKYTLLRFWVQLVEFSTYRVLCRFSINLDQVFWVFSIPSSYNSLYLLIVTVSFRLRTFVTWLEMRWFSDLSLRPLSSLINYSYRGTAINSLFVLSDSDFLCNSSVSESDALSAWISSFVAIFGM